MRSSTSAGTGCAVAMLLGRMDLTQAAAERGFCLGLGLDHGLFSEPSAKHSSQYRLKTNENRSIPVPSGICWFRPVLNDIGNCD